MLQTTVPANIRELALRSHILSSLEEINREEFIAKTPYLCENLEELATYVPAARGIYDRTDFFFFCPTIRGSADVVDLVQATSIDEQTQIGSPPLEEKLEGKRVAFYLRDYEVFISQVRRGRFHCRQAIRVNAQADVFPLKCTGNRFIIEYGNVVLEKLRVKHLSFCYTTMVSTGEDGQILRESKITLEAVSEAGAKICNCSTSNMSVGKNFKLRRRYSEIMKKTDHDLVERRSVGNGFAEELQVLRWDYDRGKVQLDFKKCYAQMKVGSHKGIDQMFRKEGIRKRLQEEKDPDLKILLARGQR